MGIVWEAYYNQGVPLLGGHWKSHWCMAHVISWWWGIKTTGWWIVRNTSLLFANEPSCGYKDSMPNSIPIASSRLVTPVRVINLFQSQEALQRCLGNVSRGSPLWQGTFHGPPVVGLPFPVVVTPMPLPHKRPLKVWGMIVLEAYGKIGVPWGNSQMRKIPSSAAQLLEQKLLRLLVKVRELQDANFFWGGRRWRPWCQMVSVTIQKTRWHDLYIW